VRGIGGICGIGGIPTARPPARPSASASSSLTLRPMAYIRIYDEVGSEVREFECDEVRFGRDPASEFVPAGDARNVVSANHARAFFREGHWLLEDQGSRNGTFLDGSQLTQGTPEELAKGSKIRLGTTGPSFRIEAVAELRVSRTMVEPIPAVSSNDPTEPMAAIDFPSPPQEASGDREPHIVIFHVASSTRLEAYGWQFRIGRGRECELRPVAQGDTSISRVHAQIEISRDGSMLVRDAGSRNGTLVNGKVIDDECSLAVGDRLGLGASGPELIVQQLDGVMAKTPVAPQPQSAGADEAPMPRPTARSSRRSFDGKGATVFFKDMFEESTRKSKSRLRWVVWAFVGLLCVSVGAMSWVSEMRVRQTAVQLAEQQARSDSLMLSSREEVTRLGEELGRASAAAAPVAVLDSLRLALSEAGARTDALELAMITAQESLNRELAAGDSLRHEAESDLARLRNDLGRAQGAQQPTARLDSLLAAVQAAEERANNIEAQMRAVRGVDLASISQASQGAIGLVTAFSHSGIYDGSGFVITASGLFITNRHVVMPQGGSADSLFVTMADQRRPMRATLVNVAEAYGPDMAVLEIAGYTGPYLQKVDWTGTHMRQGEPAALIGFPAGMVAAMDASSSGTVRTSMSAGIFSKVETERVQFDGFTISGSSGSPIFNANGEVVAVHRSGLREAAGLGFGVPIDQLIPLLPPRVRAELGIR
jgi:pSer/pThr/pTyr-binding forkhead associated (FHA) protein/S1-C subfamily serine protease